MQNKYEKIINYIKNSIKHGDLKSGQKITSIRKIAEEFKCSRSTIIRAFEELRKENVIFSVPQSGYFVLGTDKKLEKKKQTANSNIFSSGPSMDTPSRDNDVSVIDFVSTSLRPPMFLYNKMNKCVNHAISQYLDSFYAPPDPMGLYGLRQVLQKQIEDLHIFTSTENMVITSGVQQALSILCAMPFPNGKKNVLLEQPTYCSMLKLLDLSHTTTLGIERNENGIDLDQLEKYFRNSDIKFFYTMPRFHNPTGYSYSTAQKKAILKLADKYDVYIIEDDYLGDLEVDPKCTPMFSMDLTGHVIYLKSFSKVVMSGIRLGLAILPKLLCNVFTQYKYCNDISTNLVSQATQETFIENGMYSKCVKDLRGRCVQNMKILKNACNEYLPPETGISYFVPKSGIFACITLPLDINANAFKGKLHAQNVLVTQIDDMFLPAYRKANIIRLSLCQVDAESITKGIQLIAEATAASAGKISDRRKSEREIVY